MMKKYTKEELNEILMSKNLSDFYIALIENRKGEILSDEEYERIVSGTTTFADNAKEKLDDLNETIKKDKKIAPFADDIFKAIFSFASVRHIGILTMINDDVYDIGSASFLDLRKNKIIHYEILTTYYDDKTARLKMVTPSEEPGLKEEALLLDVDDESFITMYERSHIKQKETDDLTAQLILSLKGKPYSLKRK